MSNRRYWLLLGATTFIYLLPLWLVRLLPFVDLPQHLSFVSILRNLANPVTDYREMFTVKLYPTHNVLHLLFCYPLSALVGVETSNRLFLSLYVILLPLALHYFLSVIGGNRWLTFAGFLFVYNFNLFWGFVSSTFVIPLVLLVMAYAIRELESARPATRKNRDATVFAAKTGGVPIFRFVAIALLFILIFLGHSLFYLFATGLYLVVVIAATWRTPSQGRTIGRMLLPQLPVLLFFVLPWQLSIFSGEGGALATNVMAGFSLGNLVSRLSSFFETVTARGDEVSFFLLKLYLVIGITAVVLYARRHGPPVLLSRRFRAVTLLTVTSLAAFLLFPAAIRQAWFLNERFTVFFYLFLTGLLGLVVAASEFRPGWVLGVLFLAVGINVASLGWRFVAFDRKARPVVRMLSKLEKDRKLLGLIYETRPKPDLLGYDVFLHFANYYQVWNRGYPGFSFASIRFSPIQYRDSTDFLPPGSEWSPSEWVFPEGWDVYDYFLVQGIVPPQDQEFVARWELLDSTGKWRLYRRPEPAESGDSAPLPTEETTDEHR
jgi:hypothetical protein